MDLILEAEAERFLSHVEQIDYENGGVFGSSPEGAKLLQLLAESPLAHSVAITRQEKVIGDRPYDVLIFVFSSTGKLDEAVIIRSSDLTERHPVELHHMFRADRFMDELIRPLLENKWGGAA